MRKRIAAPAPKPFHAEEAGWLDLEPLAEIELSSEDGTHPIEAALLPEQGPAWRAADPGPQTIRILFDLPQSLKLIHLVFTEESRTRTQEFVLRWSSNDGGPMREIVRQSYNFSPGSREEEDYVVDLAYVKSIELAINPAIDGAAVYASLAELRLR
jgi:hypothetical protein